MTPLSILTFRLVIGATPDSRWNRILDEAKFTVPYFQSLTALVFGLSGLNVWDRRNGKTDDGKTVKPDK